ncbi:hypothetical protein [Pseudomonas sp. LRF_L74]|uniref:hypothetical protein n=1 Tax=Pseudomonas sp. LRF_L74 TaxID=3369422 RepID=UPI003F631A98
MAKDGSVVPKERINIRFRPASATACPVAQIAREGCFVSAHEAMPLLPQIDPPCVMRNPCRVN